MTCAQSESYQSSRLAVVFTAQWIVLPPVVKGNKDTLLSNSVLKGVLFTGRENGPRDTTKPTLSVY